MWHRLSSLALEFLHFWAGAVEKSGKKRAEERPLHPGRTPASRALSAGFQPAVPLLS